MTGLPPYFDASNLATFKFRSGDIIITCGAKSGLHWLKHQVSQLIAEAPENNPPISKLVPWLEWRFNQTETNEERNKFLEEFDWSVTKGQRIFCSHQPFGPEFALPFRDDVKYLVSARNPFDVMISLYLFLQEHNHEFMEAWGTDKMKNVPLAGYVELIINGQLPIFLLTEVIWKYRHHKNVLLVHFSDMKNDLRGHMEKVCQFLEVNPDRQTFERVLERSSFEWMKKNFDFTEGLGYRKPDGTLIHALIGQHSLLRKGAVNDEFEDFTSELRERFDKSLREKWDPQMYQWMMGGGSLP